MDGNGVAFVTLIGEAWPLYLCILPAVFALIIDGLRLILDRSASSEREPRIDDEVTKSAVNSIRPFV